MGSFIGNCYASDFADLDNDGDLDLVHSSYTQPTRMFLNDGDGRFQEFNPSGFMAFGGLFPGNPGLWCEGLYEYQTLDVSGALCDISTYAWDLELADVDGDFDQDLILNENGSKLPRFFANRLEGSGLVAGLGVLGFRDMAGLSFAALPEPFAAPRTADLGDLDGDGDLDVYGASWDGLTPFPLWDAVYENQGDGVFAAGLDVEASGGEEHDADLSDVDGDGDLDALLASNGVRLYLNQGNLLFLNAPAPAFGPGETTAVADTDGDGDYDALFGRSNAEDFYRNITQVPDSTPPRLPEIEALVDTSALPGVRPLRAHVLDNAPFSLVRFYAGELCVEVDGIRLPALEAASAGGQIFRAKLPANLVGAVSYSMACTDGMGNQGVSATSAFTSSLGASFQQPYGSATAGMAGGAPLLRALSAPFGASTLYLAVSSDAAPGTPVWLGLASQKLDPGVAVPGLLFLQASGTVFYTGTGLLDANGDAVSAIAIPAVPAGIPAYAQAFVFDPTATGDLLASSQGLALMTQ